jgi:hypothetical protein
MKGSIPLYYLNGKIDYVWIPKDIESSQPKSISATTDAKIDYTELQHILSSNTDSRVWLLSDPLVMWKVKSKKLLLFFSQLEPCAIYKGLDTYTTVYLIKPGHDGEISCVNPS